METACDCATLTIIALTGKTHNASLLSISILLLVQGKGIIDRYVVSTIPQYTSLDRERCLNGVVELGHHQKSHVQQDSLAQREPDILKCLLGSVQNGMDIATDSN
jgi:hypothetical protein